MRHGDLMLYLRSFSVQSRTYQNFRSWHVYLTKLLVQAYWNKILVFWTRSYYLYHSNKVCFCLEYQAQRIQSWEEGMIWNDWDICLRFSCSLLYTDGLKESSGKLSLNILLHFCLWLRNNNATYQQSSSYTWTILYRCHHKTHKHQKEQKPTGLFGSIWAASIPFLRQASSDSFLFAF